MLKKGNFLLKEFGDEKSFTLSEHIVSSIINASDIQWDIEILIFIQQNNLAIFDKQVKFKSIEIFDFLTKKLNPELLYYLKDTVFYVGGEQVDLMKYIDDRNKTYSKLNQNSRILTDSVQQTLLSISEFFTKKDTDKFLKKIKETGATLATPELFKREFKL